MLKIKKQKADKKLVLVTGCFDILHSAHQKFLQKAKTKNSLLLVGLESDKRVRVLKGKERPVNSWTKRAKNLSEQKFVDYIFHLPEDLEKKETQELLIAELKPDILAVSSHTKNLDRKKLLIEKYGGQLKIVYLHNPHFSTTKILGTVSI